MATTLSLVVIFLPVAFMTGYARRFIYPFGWTMAFAILVSMLVSFTLTPMLSSRFLKRSDAQRRSKTKEARLFHWLDRWYTRVAAMDARSPDVDHRHLGCASSLTLPLNWMVGRTFVPTEDMGEFTVHVDTPEGTSLEGTTEIARKLVKEIGELEGVAQMAYRRRRRSLRRTSTCSSTSSRRTSGRSRRRRS